MLRRLVRLAAKSWAVARNAPSDLWRKVDTTLSGLTARRMFWWTASLNLILVVAFLGLLVLPAWTGQFTSDVLTRSLILQLPRGGRAPSDLLNRMSIVRRGCTEPVLTLDQPLPASVQLEFAFGGAEPSVTVRPMGAATVYGSLRTCDGKMETIDRAVIFHPFASEWPHTTYVAEGIVQLGQVAGDHRDDMLEEGRITASSWSMPFHSSRVSQTTELVLGDQVRFFDDREGKRPAMSSEIITVDWERKAFRVVSHSAATVAEVARIGTDTTYPILHSPTTWERLQAQSEWATTLVVIACFFNILSALGQYVASKSSEAGGVL